MDPSPSPPSSTVEEAPRRREPREFDPAGAPEPALLERILAVAAMAPSPFNLQPWRFLVVRDETGRRRLKSCARNDPRIAGAAVAVIVLGYHHPDRTHLGPMLEARVASGELTSERAAEIRGRAASALRDVRDRAEWANRWAMPAATLLMIAAGSFGVDSVLADGFDEEAVRREFGVPDDHSVCCLIALGRAIASEPFPGRLGPEEIVFVEHFGRPAGA